MTIPVVSETAFALAGGVFSEPWLLDAALATAAIETPIFWLCGYRRAAEWRWFFVVNIVSNLLLNEFNRYRFIFDYLYSRQRLVIRLLTGVLYMEISLIFSDLFVHFL